MMPMAARAEIRLINDTRELRKKNRLKRLVAEQREELKKLLVPHIKERLDVFAAVVVAKRTDDYSMTLEDHASRLIDAVLSYAVPLE